MQGCIHQSQHGSPVSYSECVFHGSLRKDAAGTLKSCLEVFQHFIFFSFAARREYPNLQARNHAVLRPELCPDDCCLGTCWYMRKKNGTSLLRWGLETSLNFACVSSYPVKEIEVRKKKNNFSYSLLGTTAGIWFSQPSYKLGRYRPHLMCEEPRVRGAEWTSHTPTGFELWPHSLWSAFFGSLVWIDCFVHMKLGIPTPDLINQDSLIIPVASMK